MMIFVISRLHRLFSRNILITIAFATFALAGCGGGGGGGGSSSSAPIAENGSLTTVKSTSAIGTLIATDADDDSLVYTIVRDGSKGTAVITDTATGAYTYTPNLGEDGTDTFTFKANDGTTDSNVATVSVQITNNAPVAQDGNLTVNQDTAGNDTLTATDADNDSLVYSIVTNGSRGTAVITDTASGAYTYTPNPGENGADTFTYKANDGTVDSNIATIAITINAAPVAESGCSTTPQAQTLNGQLMASDSDSNLLMFDLKADGSEGAGPITTANGGTVTLTDQTTGTFDYVPASAGGRGSDTFSYQVSDPEGNVDSAAETVIVDIKIMPFGDSITDGVTNGNTGQPVSNQRVGYRKPLYTSLINDGFSFDFVGSKTVGGNILNDAQTESHPSWTASELALGQLMNGTDGIYAWLTANPADIVLVHAGTNGLAGDTAGNGVTAILNQIDVWESSLGGNPVTVLLAEIIDQDPIDSDVTDYNANIVNIAAGRPDIDGTIDQFSALTYPDDLNDQLHPNTSGYGKMADTWFSKLQTIIDKCPP